MSLGGEFDDFNDCFHCPHDDGSVHVNEKLQEVACWVHLGEYVDESEVGDEGVEARGRHVHRQGREEQRNDRSWRRRFTMG